MRTEQRHHADVIFEKNERDNNGKIPPLRAVAVPPNAGYSRDGGFTLEASENTDVKATHVSDAERTMKSKVKPEPVKADEGGLPSILFSIAGLASATVRFTLRELRTGLRMLTNPWNAPSFVEQSIRSWTRAIDNTEQDYKTDT
jgi:hypothetical protein